MSKGQRIRLRREELGIGLTELAIKIDVSKQTLYKYENDIVTNIPSDKIEELAKALYTTPAYLMGWTDRIAEYVDGTYEVDIETAKITSLNNIKSSVEKAEILYKLYENATPDVQSAVELLLKSAQQNS